MVQILSVKLSEISQIGSQAKSLSDLMEGQVETGFRCVTRYLVRQPNFLPRKTLNAPIEHVAGHGVALCQKFIKENLHLKLGDGVS
jgi:hypothetical protein